MTTSDITPKERLDKVLRREAVDRPPLIVPTQNATVSVMEEAGIFWPDALQNAKPMAELALACQRVYGFESIRLPFDINVEAETMGCETRYGGPSDPPLSTPKNRVQLGELKYPNPRTDGRMAQVIEAVSIVAKEKDPALPLIVAAGSPFEVLCTIYNFDDLRADMKSNGEVLEELLEKILEVMIKYAKAIEEAGADVMMVVDGTSQTLIPKQFKRYSAPYTKRQIESFTLPSILHICGNPSRLISDMVDTGANGLSLDWQVPFDKAREDSAGKVALIGGLDVMKLEASGADDIREMVKEANAQDLDVVAPGCGIMPTTPLENVLAYVNAVKEG